MSPSLGNECVDAGVVNGRVFPQGDSTQLKPGFYVPTVAFFHDATEAVDIETTKRHAIRLAEAGVSGLVTQGSNGEAVHLSHDERKLINQASRDALDSIGRHDMPLIVGCGAQSVRETVQLCEEAAASGGQFALVLPPSYYAALLNKQMIKGFFEYIADKSPMPVIIYNYPGACGGLDLDSDVITALSHHKNIAGVKLTCGNTGKLARIRGAVTTPFLTMGGSADFTLQAAAVGGDGIIGGFGNIFPKTCVRLFELCRSERMAEARPLQEVVARGDWVAIKGGFVAVKVALEAFYGYGGKPRLPCSLPATKDINAMVVDFGECWEYEGSL